MDVLTAVAWNRNEPYRLVDRDCTLLGLESCRLWSRLVPRIDTKIVTVDQTAER